MPQPRLSSPDMLSRLRRAWIYCGLILVLAACGGGNGGGSTTAPGYSLSGTITLPETAAVDSDTNDPVQANRAKNDSLATAQAITTPVQLVGTLNQPYAGPDGANLASGDVDDVFKITLTAGQVVELTFVGDTAQNDVDLLLVDADTITVVGKSDSETNSTECIRVGRSGNYYLIADAYKGAAIYNMRIGAPGETSCANVSTSTSVIVADQLVAKPSSRVSRSAQRTLIRAANLQTLDGDGHERAHLLRLAPGGAQRERGFAQLRQSRARKTARDATSGTADKLFGQPGSEAQRAIETIHYAKQLMATGLYDYVEPNVVVALQSTGYVPDDPQYLPQRWHYQQINQPAAMDRINALGVTPVQRPLVAVIDSGIVANHPDLQPQIADGRSFISRSTLGDGDSADPNDPSRRADSPVWHGTHVAGTIAAASNNAAFGAGVAPMALLMPLRVFAPGASGASSYDIIQAIRYAAGLSNRSGIVAARRADVINMSLGNQSTCQLQFSAEINNARAAGVVVVASAGNAARNDLGTPAGVASPANCPGVIAVGATDARARQTYYSNSGAALTLAAPGGDPSQATTGTGYPDGIYSTLGNFDMNDLRIASFGQLSGTSMAAPHVAGVIALMRYVHPGITPAQIDTLIAAGLITDDIGASGRDDATGYGLINARKAVEEALALASSSSTAPGGIVIASPASISFGSMATLASLELKTTASTTESVISIVSDVAAVSIAESSVDAATRLGIYAVSVDRNLLPLGTSFPTLTVTTDTRTFTVQLTIVKAATANNSQADYGRVIVRIESASTGMSLGQGLVFASGGKYAWSISGIPPGEVRIIAGTDLDNDALVCELGEVCGRYPDPSTNLIVSGNTGGLDFSIAPTGTTTSSSLQNAVVKSRQ